MADQVFRIAMEEDDITDLTRVLENYMREEVSRTWKNNPLRIACDCRSVNCAKEIIRLKPDLAWQRNQDGSSIAHYICETADVTIVKALVEVDPRELCPLRDNQFRTLVHMGAINGDEEVMRVLLTLCPQSIERLTALKETVFHLALKNNHLIVFRVLMEELGKRDRGDILNCKDEEGNTVLQIATSGKQIQILKILLSYKSTNGDPAVEVNSRNKRGFTALDIHYQNISDMNDKDISDLLYQAGAKEGHLLCSLEEQPSFLQSPRPEPPRSTTTKTIHQTSSSANKPVLLTVFSFVAGVVYASIFTLNNIYPLEKDVGISTVSGKDMIMAPYLLPNIFFFMVFITVTFKASMVVIVINTWSLVRKWSFWLLVCCLIALGGMVVSYAFVAKEVMPRFWITFGSHKISSFSAMWLCGLLLVFVVVIVWFLAKQILSIFSK